MNNPSVLSKLAEKSIELCLNNPNLSKEKLAELLSDMLKPLLKQWGVVTREEFDIQVNLLAKAREKLEQLENNL